MSKHDIINKQIAVITAGWGIEDYQNFVYDRMYDELALEFEEGFDV